MADLLQGLLGVFPSFETPGGVQRSGQVAWERIAGPSTILFCYGRNGATPIAPGGRAVYAADKVWAVLTALRGCWPVQTVLIWHLALLKLLPFFRVKDAQVILFLHGVEAWGPLDWATRRLLRRVNRFLTNSDHTWERFAANHPPFERTPHRTVHLGVGSPLAGPAPAPGPIPAALMVSRLVRSEDYKGHRQMIAAWPEVRKWIAGAQLWISGDGDLRPDLEAFAARLGLADSVRFLGPISEANKRRLLSESRCLAMPSRGEGFGLVYAEAMRMGRPCLVSTVDAGREVVNPPEAGLAADPHDVSQVVATICRLLTPGGEWEGWSARARARYERLFTAAHFQQRLAAAL